MASAETFGNRTAQADSARVRSWVILLVLLFILNGTLGFNLELDRTDFLNFNSASWVEADYRKGIDDEFLAPKKPGQYRVLYLSNSHAFTGGMVTAHLQGFLESLAPGRFEVLNMAEPGIFAPDMLQRGMRALDYDIDVAILGTNYINFSDRMRLELQAHSARSFFNTGIASRLPAGFWLRNYDIGLYGTVLTQRISHLYRNRNALRNLWEQPLAAALRTVSTDNRPVFFVEMEQDERWRFPDGYDNNLFQWNLYASGRRGHMKDMESLLNTYAVQDIPLIALNLPIDFGKSVYTQDTDDVNLFRQQLKSVASRSTAFVDYQADFPVAFSTYDALHTTRHGARLHAFSMVLQLKEHGWLGDISEEQLLDMFRSSDQGVSQAYLDAIDGNYPPHPNPFGFRRYDPSEPANARELMQQLAAFSPGTANHNYILGRLARVIRFWTESEFRYAGNDSATWNLAVVTEIDNARQRMAHFRQAVTEFELQRLAALEIPETGGLEPDAQEEMTVQGKTIVRRVFSLPTGDTMVTLSLPDGRIFGKGISGADGRVFYRADILGNDSFIQVSSPEEFSIPEWVINPEPNSRWGI